MVIPTFYIENTPGQNQLEQLLDKQAGKLVFRLQQQSDDTLQLWIFRYRPSKCDEDFKLKLKVLDDGFQLDIKGKTVFWCDQEIGARKNHGSGEEDFQSLKKLLNKSGSEYIIVKPVSIDAENYLVYELHACDKLEVPYHEKLLLSFKPNPCPPCTGY